MFPVLIESIPASHQKMDFLETVNSWRQVNPDSSMIQASGCCITLHSDVRLRSRKVNFSSCIGHCAVTSTTFITAACAPSGIQSNWLMMDGLNNFSECLQAMLVKRFACYMCVCTSIYIYSHSYISNGHYLFFFSSFLGGGWVIGGELMILQIYQAVQSQTQQHGNNRLHNGLSGHYPSGSRS